MTSTKLIFRAGATLLALPVCLQLTACADLGQPASEQPLWFAPPSEPEPVPREQSQLAAEDVAALPSTSAYWRESRRSAPNDPTIQLADVLDSVRREYPLLDLAQQELILTTARQIGALGAFDLKLKGEAEWQPIGGLTHNRAKVGLEQPTGIWGASVFGGYKVGAGEFNPDGFEAIWDGGRLTNHGGEFSGGLAVPLLRGGATDPARTRIFQSEIERAQAEVELALRQLQFEFQASLAYWDWVAAGYRLRVIQELLDLTLRRQEWTQTRVERGVLGEIELVDVRTRVLKREALVVKARRTFEKTAIKLSLFLRDEEGKPSRDLFVLNSEGEPVTADPAVLPRRIRAPEAPRNEALVADLAAALRMRPEPRLLELELQLAGLDMELAENMLLPQLDVFVQVSKDLDSDRPTSTKGPTELLAGLSFSFPLQNRKARGKRLEAATKLDMITIEAGFLRDKIRNDVLDALSAINAAFRTAELMEDSIDGFEELRDAERIEFEAGTSDNIALNLRENAVAEAEITAIDAKTDYWRAAAAYRAAIGFREPTVGLE